jgi:hypothetical protein
LTGKPRLFPIAGIDDHGKDPGRDRTRKATHRVTWHDQTAARPIRPRQAATLRFQ